MKKLLLLLSIAFITAQFNTNCMNKKKQMEIKHNEINKLSLEEQEKYVQKIDDTINLMKSFFQTNKQSFEELENLEYIKKMLGATKQEINNAKARELEILGELKETAFIREHSRFDLHEVILLRFQKIANYTISSSNPYNLQKKKIEASMEWLIKLKRIIQEAILKKRSFKENLSGNKTLVDSKIICSTN